jgi:predicted branched-subunit amino acid permease
VRAGVPYATAGGLFAVSLGVVALDAGFSALGIIVMSAVVFAGSAQFAAISIVAAGGGLGAAVGAAALMNSRFLPMGIALAPSLRARALTRAVQGQAIVDASWVMANEGEGRFDRHFMFGATSVQYATWLAGTALGALGGGALGDTHAASTRSSRRSSSRCCCPSCATRARAGSRSRAASSRSCSCRWRRPACRCWRRAWRRSSA